MKNSKTEKIVTAAMLIAIGTAISFICELIPFLNLPFGGTITIASMLPLVVISYMYGIKWGLGSGFVYAILQMAVGCKTVAMLFTPESDSYMGVAIAFGVIFFDYICAFTSVGLGGMFRNVLGKTTALILGSIASITICYFFHTLSGAIFYGSWAEWFFTDTVVADIPTSKWIMDNLTGGGLAAVYSACYNGCYMIPEIIISAIAAAPVSKISKIRKY